VLFVCIVSLPSFGLEQEKASEIKGLLNKGEYKKAKELLDQAISKTPNSIPILYQSARYYMKTEYAKDDSIIGFHYSALTENASVYALEKILGVDPKYAEAYSLLGHIYVVQNNVLEAEKNFAKAETLSPRPVWLDFNKALLAMQKKEFKQAVTLLKKYTGRYNKLPKSKQMADAKASLYSASWNMLKRIVVKHPELDPVKAIREGLIKRINPKDFADFLKLSKNNQKDLYVHFTSSDEWCSSCLKNNSKLENLAKKHADKYSYIHVSFEPWSDIDYFNTTIAKPIIITKLPTQIIYKEANPVLFKAGSICDCSFNQMINGSFEKIDPSRNQAVLPEESDVMGRINYYFDNYVATDKNYKAFAVVIDDDYWMTGTSREWLSQSYANKRALEKCEYNKNKVGKTKQSCQLFGVGNKKVYGFLQGDIEQITQASEQQRIGPIDKIIENYKRQKKVKVLAIAVDQYHHWNTFYYADDEQDGCEDLDECREKVLERCNHFRAKWKTTTPCQVYFENNKQVKEFELPEFK
jgi:tetratricopeptide (TPR) repeat protein